MEHNEIKKKILLAGATGYLGNYIAKELISRNMDTKIIVRKPGKIIDMASKLTGIIQAEVTRPETIRGHFHGVDTVISTVGITRQKDGLTYMDVDYGANMNLLDEAKRAGVKKFIYVSVINGQLHRNLKLVEAKEAFVDQLKASGLDYTIIRPNGFFSDMRDFLKMAEKGSVYIFGKGKKKFNPIHGADLAQVCVDAINSNKKEIAVGGPDILTHYEVAEMALLASGKPINIIHVPHWLRKSVLWIMRTFTSSKTYGPIEFFLTLMAEDAIAPRYGSHRLSHYFQNEMDTLKKRT
ncbi:SDR family oxidoreductase [Arenibacter palladensis]|uniref:SDR family oxidoreductase n=1 Tax=Arenibacter palladensis TaxID=237373 RepID=UPI0026E3E74B|nr:SDR family oxidoreductase [Arenibacter palladensis]MDO6603687.1 SDR family oxidoreductase [Arenibacter palladensis]